MSNLRYRIQFDGREGEPPLVVNATRVPPFGAVLEIPDKGKCTVKDVKYTLSVARDDDGKEMQGEFNQDVVVTVDNPSARYLEKIRQLRPT